MPMASNGLHRKRDHKGRKPMLWEAELTIAVASAVVSRLMEVPDGKVG